jgi:6-phosphogluconate dehydrogenase
MSNEKCDVAVIGLGVMGANLARNFASRGHRVAVFNRTATSTRELTTKHPDAAFVGCESLEALVSALQRPRRIVLMVPAGSPVDDSLDALDPLLDTDDIVIDAGNSLYSDTDRRSRRAEKAVWRFVGMGVSGGSEGALKGPSIMPGGDPEAWEHLRPILESIAAVADSGPCVAYCGRGSAGHFVKMVHNGIEYGDMQLIAESAVLLRKGLGLSPSAIADVFGEWNHAELESYLIEITAEIFRTADPEVSGGLLLDAILDRAGQKGTGRWTAKAALDLGVAIPTIAAAVDARSLSSNRERRVAGEAAFEHRKDQRLVDVSADDIRAALYAAKIASYSQGFDLLARASEERDYGTDLAEVARIWKAGCIIRARFLDRVRAAFGAGDSGRAGGESDGEGQGSENSPALLAFSPIFREELASRIGSWRRVVAAAVMVGIPVPGLAASLAWFDTLTTADGSTNLIQAQRDYFGSHTYERVDAPGEFVHTDWSGA